MSDFTSGFWSVYIALATLISIAACLALLVAFKRNPGPATPEVTGHVWDNDLQEFNNPLPRWWIGLFYLTIVFGLVYLALYPGLGSVAGILGWTSRGQYAEEDARAAAVYGPIFDQYQKQDLKSVAADPEARRIGQRLFLTYCSQCHGSDAGGSRGFPNLRDQDWLYGGEPETIKQSIMEGRSGVMPPWQAVLGDQGVKEVANYVLSLSGSKHDATLAAAGKPKFEANCVACHTAAGTGNRALGAPNLTDRIWLYGGTETDIVETLKRGRNGKMPPHKDTLGAAKVHLLAAYVYSLGSDGAGKADSK